MSQQKVFNILSIGQRGVGKTVFLAGSFAELHPDNQLDSPPDRSQLVWFDSQNLSERKKLESILTYVADNGKYPPATIKITDFNFTLKRRQRKDVQSLCDFRWWDIPGEDCNLNHPDFQKMVLSSHSCCVFIDAYALANEQTYVQAFETITKQVGAIASLVYQRGVKYAFALIFTKYDLVEANPISLLQLEEHVQPLVTRLDTLKANYQRFYSAVPIVIHEGRASLKPKGAAAPLLWLISELAKTNNLTTLPDLGSGLMQGAAKTAKETSAARKIPGINLPIKGRSILILTIGILSLIGLGGLAFVSTLSPKQAQSPEQQIEEYEKTLQQNPNNFDALINIVNLRLQLGQISKAIPLMEKLVSLEPERVDLRLNLAKLYELTGQNQKAEAAYDYVIDQQSNNVTALVNKALLRSKQGDNKTAKELFTQAEKSAPSDLKTKIQDLAKNTLPETTEAKQVEK